jgi:hypothetical protein
MNDSVALILIWFPVFAIAFAWWRTGRSKSPARTTSQRLYFISLVTQSLSCLIYFAALYFRVVQLSLAPFPIVILAFLTVVLCLTTALLLPFGSGPFRYYLVGAALLMSWSLLQTIGLHRAYGLTLALPLFWLTVAWTLLLRSRRLGVPPRSAILSMLATTASALLAVVLLAYTRFVVANGGPLTSLAVSAAFLCVFGAITALIAIRKNKHWFGYLAMFLSLWMLSIWGISWSRL